MPVREAAVVRWLLALLLAICGAVMLVFAERVRGEEAALAGMLASAVTDGSSSVDRAQATFFFALHTPLAAGLRVTPECSIAYIIGPVLIALGFLALLRRLSPRSVMGAAGVSLGFLFLTNTARIAFIAWSVYRFGATTGYWWSHLVVGSAFSLITITIAIALAVRISFVGSGVSAPRRRIRGHATAP